MSLLLSIEPLFYVILFFLSVCSFTFAAPSEIKNQVVTDVTEDFYYNYYISVLRIADTGYIDGGSEKIRVKRAGGGAGKFSDAASMGPMKVAQLFLTFAKNLFTSDPIGGVHPMSRSVPGPVVQLLKGTIYKQFFPDLNADH